MCRQKMEQLPLWDGKEWGVNETETEKMKKWSDKNSWVLSDLWIIFFLLWSHALIPSLNWLFQLISHELIRSKTLQEMCLFRTENRSSVQTSPWPASVSTSSFAFLTSHNYRPNYPLLGGLVCMAASKLNGRTLTHCLPPTPDRAELGSKKTSEQNHKFKNMEYSHMQFNCYLW